MKHIETAVLSRLEVAFAPPRPKAKPRRGTDKWWKSLSKREQKEYIKKYPGSKYNPANKRTKKKVGKKLVKKKPNVPGLPVKKGKPHTERQIRQDEKKKVTKEHLRKEIERKAKEAKKKKALDAKNAKKAALLKKKQALKKNKAKQKALKKKPTLTKAEQAEQDRLKAEQKAQEKLIKKQEAWEAYHIGRDEPDDTELPEDIVREPTKVEKIAQKVADWFEEKTHNVLGAIKQDILRRLHIDAKPQDPRPKSVKMYDSLKKLSGNYRDHIRELEDRISQAKKSHLAILKAIQASSSVDEQDQLKAKLKELDARLDRILAKKKEYKGKMQECDTHMSSLQDRRDRYSDKQGEEKERRQALRDWGVDSRTRKGPASIFKKKPKRLKRRR